VSFVEAIDRTKYDLRWKVALGLEMEEVPMQKSTLQEFEARLVIQEMEEPWLKKSIAEARRAGYRKSRKVRVALDTTPILGKGAVKDTYPSAGGRHRTVGLPVGGRGRGERRDLGGAARVESLFWQQCER
jgi:hypothetical protein